MRGAAKKYGYGVELDSGEGALFNFDRLSKERAVTARVGSKDVVVFFEPDSGDTRAYDATGRKISWDQSRKAFTDANDGSVWDPDTGTATAGLAKGTTLPRLRGLITYIVAWRHFHPNHPMVT